MQKWSRNVLRSEKNENVRGWYRIEELPDAFAHFSHYGPFEQSDSTYVKTKIINSDFLVINRDCLFQKRLCLVSFITVFREVSAIVVQINASDNLSRSK